MAYITFQPKNYFNTILYTGTSSAPNAKTGVNFQPDLVWIKPRTFADPHRWHSPLLTGTDYFLKSNSTDGEAQNANSITSFDSDGFTLGNTDGGWNSSSYTYVAWNWLAGNGTSSNTDGSITSTVSANTTSGFSIVKYTGNSTAGATIGHGLGVAPKVVIVKVVGGSTNQWCVYHGGLDVATPADYVTFFSTAASTNIYNIWNDTAPSSSVVTLGDNSACNLGYDYIAYCFAEVKGFSKFGSYTGNGSADGTFVFTGFRPAFVLVKNSTTSGPSWVMLDNKRNTYNPESNYLQPNTSDAEASSAYADFLSNGFKFKSADNWVNGSGATYIYMAFAESPLVTSNGLPSNAR